MNLRGPASVVLAASLGGAEASAQRAQDLADLSLEQLADVKVTSASRRAEPWTTAPASIYVITASDIRRAGATTLAEALRLAPNLQVARFDAAQYAISARGFNNLVANKLLVLVDGRTIYTPLFSGVFWDQQDLLLDDVERIEVISGPGATLWGANAVNGVINVITRAARATPGVYATVAAGTQERLAGVRSGLAVGSRAHVRVYGKGTLQDDTERADGTSVIDGRRFVQGGFRADWAGSRSALTVQGDAYDGRSDDRGSVAGFPLGRVELSGMNLLARWSRQLGQSSELRLQGYVDHVERKEAVLFQPTADLYDADAQLATSAGPVRVVTGGGFRHGRDDVADGILIGFRPRARSLDWMNVYAHGELPLGDRLRVDAGIKLERNDYTGWEHLPSARVSWTPAQDQFVWAAASRAVRAPARLDREVIAPVFMNVFGGPDFQSEVANVFEVGYRGVPVRRLSLSVTGFRHGWDRLRSGTAVPVVIENRIEGPVYGVEGWATWFVADRWRVSGGFSALHKDLRLEPGSTDPVGVANPQLANDPGRHWMARSSLTLGRHDLDAMVRHVGGLPTPPVPSYTAVDARYALQLRNDLELSLLARNLFDRAHPEFGAAPGRSELGRELLLRARWSR